MKKTDIINDNYSGKWDRSRVACRGIIIDGSQILLSYETAKDQWLIPGGGKEDDESDKECCIREVLEETGMIVEVGECLVEINQYFDSFRHTNRYFVAKVIKEAEMKLTEREKGIGVTSRWISVEKALAIFSGYKIYEKSDPERCGLYQREYTALMEIVR
ncbi:MAG: NUDIX domain-containing protein [Erysipelotrichaceae bacterium]|mgnify:CR=1 FL=1|nr:NUDIX domain-containing protein [Erysipelotrichaceae bacterium]